MSSRTKNTTRNIYASYMLMIIQILFQFVSRTAVIYSLGEQYLGLSSLYSSVLSVLNIAELGFSTSIIYFMYKPLAENDVDRVCALLSYFRKVYRIIGTIIFISGILVTPFLTWIIKGDVPDDINIYALYILYLANTSVSYFLFTYKTALLTALQRLDLTKIVNSLVIVIQYVLQLVALLVFHNYYLFVVTMIVGTALVNFFAAYISYKKYPQYQCRGDLDQASKKDIASKVKGLMICNISGVTYTSLDNIIISAFIGLKSVALYGNYMVIYNSVSSLVVIIRQAMQASVGNSIASETKKKNLEDMRLWQFMFSIIGTWCATCLLCIYQPFMVVWMGSERLLPMIVVVLLSVWFMISIVQHAYYLYLTGNGLWNEMKWSYIFSTCFNLTMNIVLGKIFGVSGIILASVLSNFISGSIWQCVILFKKYYNISPKQYLIDQVVYFVKAGIISSLTYLACSFVPSGGIVGLILKAFICILVVSSLIIIVYCRNEYFTKSKKLLFRVLHVDTTPSK